MAALRGFAGLTALALGGVYAFGALIKMTQLRGADQSALDTIQLVPLEQILVTGIRGSVVLIVSVVAGQLAILIMEERRARRGQEPLRGRGFTWPDIFGPRESIGDWIVQGGSVLGGVALVLFADPGGVAFVVWVWLVLWLASPKATSGTRLVTILVLAFVAVVVALEYLSPRPLPQATVELRSGETVEGALIAQTDAQVAVATGDHEFAVYPTAEVSATQIASTEDQEPRESLWEELTNN